jgi:DNA-nicking Smr family endonuclease
LYAGHSLYYTNMKKKPDISLQDLNIFHSAVKGVKRIRTDKIPLLPPHAQPIKKARKKETESHAIDLNEIIDLPTVGSEEKISFNQPGISHKTLRNLRKGQYNVEAVLDLHGMTINDAKTAVNKFLRQCINDNIRVVLIIHGKGRGKQPILKNKLNHWLRGLTAVLAFCSASSSHGSRGAMYVLLRNMQREK